MIDLFKKIRHIFRIIFWTLTFVINIVNIILFVDKIINVQDNKIINIIFLAISIFILITNIILVIKTVSNKAKRTISTSRRYVKLFKIIVQIISLIITVFSFSSFTSFLTILFLPFVITFWSINIFITILQILFGHLLNKRADKKEELLKNKNKENKEEN